MELTVPCSWPSPPERQDSPPGSWAFVLSTPSLSQSVSVLSSDSERSSSRHYSSSSSISQRPRHTKTRVSKRPRQYRPRYKLRQRHHRLTSLIEEFESKGRAKTNIRIPLGIKGPLRPVSVRFNSKRAFFLLSSATCSENMSYIRQSVLQKYNAEHDGDGIIQLAWKLPSHDEPNPISSVYTCGELEFMWTRFHVLGDSRFPEITGIDVLFGETQFDERGRWTDLWRPADGPFPWFPQVTARPAPREHGRRLKTLMAAVEEEDGGTAWPQITMPIRNK
ncbi:hypothetical protein QBC41DRAFT_32126 [Cercophora samala]|uniref:Uncharacterized protein n=1 Tax=Cercophora samala TaxID=330535 RepID=A0AA40D6C3_9PEZI|nr:hypothetical protein QBC41DRAFT_32126 [Cercophora samala]